MTSPIAPLCRALAERSVRYLLIGVSGANFYIPPSWPSFVTQDYDLFLPPDANNLRRAGRDKDKLFLATHRDALEQLLKKPELD